MRKMFKYIKNKINGLDNFKILIIGLVLVVGPAFYWFDLRPTQIRRECDKEARVRAQAESALGYESQLKVYKDWWSICLHGNGLN